MDGEGKKLCPFKLCPEEPALGQRGLRLPDETQDDQVHLSFIYAMDTFFSMSQILPRSCLY